MKQDAPAHRNGSTSISVGFCSSRARTLSWILTALLAGAPLWAGSTGTTELLPIQGDGAPRSHGDFVTDAGGLETYYAYFIEVPPGLSRLVIDIFDGDVVAGVGEAAANRDEQRSGGTTADYSLRDPFGTVQGTQFTTGSATLPTGGDNAWLTFYDSDDPRTPPAFEALNSATQSSNVTSISVTIPGSPCATGDLLLASVATDGSPNVGTPSGWTLINQGNASGGSARLEVFRRTAVASDVTGSATVTFTWTGGQEVVAAVACYSGVDTSSPIDVSGTNTGNNDTPSAPSVTTTVPNTMLVRMYAADDDDLSGTPYPTGHTGRLNAESGPGGGTVSHGIADATQTSAGATGAADFDLSGGGEQWRAITLALKAEDPTEDATPGHWELRVDQSATTGDDVNAIGIRAHDGTPGAGGTELNVYAQSFQTYGTNNNGGSSGTRSYTHHPYITSGCDFAAIDFDWDAGNTGNQGSMEFFLPSGGAAHDTVPDADLSGNDVWESNTVPAFTESVANTQSYGIWDLDLEISGPGSSGNYAQIYLEDDQGPGPDPDSQPETNAFRLYLPTDGGDAPDKPYLEQFVRHDDGPNPPDTGQTSTFTVTVRLVNPTDHSLTFSGSNLVVANVPGSGVVYAGNDQVSQGTVTSEPSIGGTGDVEWNPGTVAAGDTEILSYEVDVTPTSDGQVLDVTGTPSSDGTEATYVDETCSGASPTCSGAQLTGATHTLGPLCELQVEENALTYVKLENFTTYFDPGSAGGLVVEWRTSSEAGSMAYELWRAPSHVGTAGSDWTPVTERAVPALFDAPQGGTYRVSDPDGRPGDRYVLFEIDRRSSASRFGPFVARPDASQAASMGLERIAKTSHYVADPVRGSIATTRDPGAQTSGLAATGTVDGLEITLRETGLYRLASSELAAAFGVPRVRIDAAIASGRLELTNLGQSVAWTPDDPSVPSGILFYGEAIDSLYTLDNVYRLRLGPGLRMRNTRTLPAVPDPTATYTAQRRYEEDVTAPLVLALDPESDYWFWTGLIAGFSGFDRWQTEFLVSDAVVGKGQFRISLLGSGISGPGGVHEVEIYLNGSLLGTDTWTGSIRDVELRIPDGLLLSAPAPTVNQIEVVALPPDGGGSSFIFVDGFEIRYPRHYRAEEDQLQFTAGGNAVVTLEDFSAPPRILEISDPKRPVHVDIVGQFVGPVSFAPTTSGPYVAVGPTALLEPASVLPYGRPHLLSQPAQHIVLAPQELAAAADRLVDHRNATGIRSRRVLLDEVINEYAHGVFDPRAIRDFLTAAEARWPRGPQYLTLVGLGTYDYRNLLGGATNLMPPLLVATESGLFASDDAFVDLDRDGLADLAVGRIPAATMTELDAFVDKLIAYESGGPSSGVLLISDAGRPSEEIDFRHESLRLGTLWQGSASVLELDLEELGRDRLRARLFDQLASGTALANYYGHGGSDVWSDDRLLELADLGSIDGPATVITGLTCLMNRFEVPGFPSLGAGLVTLENSGAVAVWSPTAPEAHRASRALGERFHRRLLQPGDLSRRAPWRDRSGLRRQRLGDLIHEVKADVAASGSPIGPLGTYVLLGDSATIFRFDALEPTHPDPPTGDNEE